MITKLEIENFKALRGKHEIPIAPITLIYGPNSGGKSSVIQALLLLKQSMDAGRFTARGSLVDLGSFQSCVWQHDITRPMRIGVSVSGAFGVAGEDAASGGWIAGPVTSALLTFRSQRVDPSEPTRVRLESCRYRMSSDDEEALDVRLRYDAPGNRLVRSDSRHLFSGQRSKSWLKRQLELQSLPHSASDMASYGAFTRASLLPHDVVYRTGLDAVIDTIFGDDIPHVKVPAWSRQPLAECRHRLESVLSALRYLGPLRVRPTRAYSPLDNAGDWVGINGEHASQQLLRGHTRRNDDGTWDLFGSWLKLLDIQYKFHVRSVGDEVLGDGIRTTLVDERTRVKVGLTDVGSGVGQVLPLLVQAAFGGAQIMCVEQPELHLHPRGQAALGDVFVDSSCVGRPEASVEGTQWIVETHSETLLLRLKRHIRNGRLAPEQVCVLYVDPGKSGSSVSQLRMDERGDFIDEWPSGFFEEAFNEVFS